MEDNNVLEVVEKVGKSSNNVLVPALVAGGVSLAVIAGSKLFKKVFGSKGKTEEVVVVEENDN